MAKREVAPSGARRIGAACRQCVRAAPDFSVSPEQKAIFHDRDVDPHARSAPSTAVVIRRSRSTSRSRTGRSLAWGCRRGHRPARMKRSRSATATRAAGAVAGTTRFRLDIPSTLGSGHGIPARLAARRHPGLRHCRLPDGRGRRRRHRPGRRARPPRTAGPDRVDRPGQCADGRDRRLRPHRDPGRRWSGRDDGPDPGSETTGSASGER